MSSSNAALEGCVSSLRSSMQLLDSSINILDSGVNDYPRLAKVLQSTRVSLELQTHSFPPLLPCLSSLEPLPLSSSTLSINSKKKKRYFNSSHTNHSSPLPAFRTSIPIRPRKRAINTALGNRPRGRSAPLPRLHTPRQARPPRTIPHRKMRAPGRPTLAKQRWRSGQSADAEAEAEEPR